jgi:hypothetical protein
MGNIKFAVPRSIRRVRIRGDAHGLSGSDHYVSKPVDTSVNSVRNNNLVERSLDEIAEVF